MSNQQTVVTKDVANRKITVTREFRAPVERVWSAYTESEILDQWWAPKPWRAETKTMDFRVGGHWLYAMVGPDGSKHWARFDYTAIDKPRSFAGQDAFCDETGARNTALPTNEWVNQFIQTGNGTTVKSELIFASEADMQKLLEMGFEEGMKMAVENLVELLEKQPA